VTQKNGTRGAQRWRRRRWRRRAAAENRLDEAETEEGEREREREREKRREVETGGPKRAKSAARRVRGRNYRGLSVAYGAQRTLMESS
jgi:hypothetical protein